MHPLHEQTQQGLNEKPQAFIHTHQPTNKCTENNHRNKEITTFETFLSVCWRCNTLPYTHIPSVVFKIQYKLFGMWDNGDGIFRKTCSKWLGKLMKHDSRGDFLSTSQWRQNELTCLSIAPQSVRNITPRNVFYAVCFAYRKTIEITLRIFFFFQ